MLLNSGHDGNYDPINILECKGLLSESNFVHNCPDVIKKELIRKELKNLRAALIELRGVRNSGHGHNEVWEMSDTNFENNLKIMLKVLHAIQRFAGDEIDVYLCWENMLKVATRSVDIKSRARWALALQKKPKMIKFGKNPQFTGRDFELDKLQKFLLNPMDGSQDDDGSSSVVALLHAIVV